MPAQERRRSDEEGDPAVAPDQAVGRCDEEPVDGSELRWARRPPQDPQLMAEDEDLEVLGTTVLTTPATDDEACESTNNEVEQGEHRPILLLC